MSKIQTQIDQIMANDNDVKNDNILNDEIRDSKGSQSTHSKVGD